MEEKQAAKRILDVLKENQTSFLNLRDLAKRAGLKGAHSKDFKKGFKLLEREKIVRLYHSGWASEGYHRASAVLIADIYTVENIEAELRGDKDDDDKQPVSPSSQTQDFKLVKIRTPCGEVSYISKSAYMQDKDLEGNFWTTA